MKTIPERRWILTGMAALAASKALAAQTGPRMLVTKDPNCGCCESWVGHLRREGFSVDVIEGPVNPLKTRLGVPRDLASCHTAQVDGYVIEGHVPARSIRRLLSERPKGIGLAVAGMPVGSPGMEVEGTEPESYEVVLFGPSGRTVFERLRGAERA